MKVEYLIGLIVLLVLILLVLLNCNKEGFLTNKERHDQFSLAQQKKYNEVGVILAATTTNGTTNVGALGTETRSLMGSVKDTSSGGNLGEYVDNPYPLEGKLSGMAAIIQKCEAVKTSDCNALDNNNTSSFGSTCAICLADPSNMGTNSSGESWAGGLVLTAADRNYGRGRRQGSSLAPYTATVGSCPAGRLVTTKAECERLQAELTCRTNSEFGTPSGCSQCFNDGIYHVVDPNIPGLIVPNSNGFLKVVGAGILNWSETNRSSNTGTITLSNSVVQTIPIAGGEYSPIILTVNSPPRATAFNPSVIYNVNDIIIFTRNGVQGVYKMIKGIGQAGYDPNNATSGVNGPYPSWIMLMPYSEYADPSSMYIAGYLESPTGNTSSPMDIYRLILNDGETGRKPRNIGPKTVNTIDVTKMAPGNGKITMRLTVRSPFTFIDSQSDEAKLCLNSPFITNPLSATLLNSDPCYARGSAPGNYNLECLQQIFQNNSCGLFPATLDKSAYPSTNAKAATLMYDSAAGRNRTIAEIADFVYQKALITVTGGLDSNGADLSISEWSAASLFCSGIPINSPCDRNSANGPLSDDCITDLWDNKGENNINGATYNLTSLARSLFSSGNTNRFCTRMGSLSPRDVNGNIRPVGMNHWKGLGGVAAVKEAMSKLHSDANTSLTNEDTKSASINQCYGIIPSSGPSYTSSYTTPPMAEVLTRNTILKTDITIPENYNYSLSFDITPYGITFGNYGGIIRITSSKTSNSFPPAYGERSPMIIFSPNSLEPYIILGDDGGSWQSWNWGVPPSEFPSLPLNQKSTIRINATGSSVLVSVRGVTKTYTQPNKRTFSRNANEKYTFYASDDTFPAANAMIENILYKINDTIIVQTPPAPAPASGPGQSL